MLKLKKIIVEAFRARYSFLYEGDFYFIQKYGRCLYRDKKCPYQIKKRHQIVCTKGDYCEDTEGEVNVRE